MIPGGRGIYVRTPGGLIHVEASINPRYPGVTIFVDDRQVAVFEYDGEGFIIRVWNGPEGGVSDVKI